MLLWSSPYTVPFWLTYRQAQEMGGSVRKAETGTQIVFYKQFAGKKDGAKPAEEQPTSSQPEEDNSSKRKPYMLASYTVFNVEQCDGLKLPELLPAGEPDIVAEDAACEALVEAWQGKPTLQRLSPTEYRACYRPLTDTVHMPARHRFIEPSLYYSTLFHELVHSTGHESRLNRTFGSSFGDDLYSREELIAETGAAFLCAVTGIDNAHSERNTTAISRTGSTSSRLTTAWSCRPRPLRKKQLISSPLRPGLRNSRHSRFVLPALAHSSIDYFPSPLHHQ